MQAIIEKSHDGDSRFTSRKPKRAGDDGSPVLFRERKITPELEAEPRVWTVFPESKCPRPFPPLTETHMSVCSNRWCNEYISSCSQEQDDFLYHRNG